jgi:uncharacterized protein (TIGR00369 family)
MENPILSILRKHIGKPYQNIRSAAGGHLQYTLLEINEGEVTASLEVRDILTNPSKQLHGGMMAMLIDEISGLAFYTQGVNTIYSTLNLNIDYLHSAQLGDTITATARAIKTGKKIANVHCEVKNEQGTVIAYGTTNLANTNIEIPQT